MNGDHHVIFKSQGGTNHKENLISLSSAEHYEIHHGTNTEAKIEILTRCYDYILPNLDKCWKGKIKHWIVRSLEESEGNYEFIFKKMGLIN